MTRRIAAVRSRVAPEQGITLIVALGVLTVLAIAGTSALGYASDGARSATYSRSGQYAYSLAEAGINNAMSVLAEPSNNALNDTLLPSSESTAMSQQYATGTAKWWGVLNRSTGSWKISAVGLSRNPTGTGGTVRRLITSDVRVVPSYTEPLNNMAWNYIFATRTGDPDGCDEQLDNIVNMGSPLYVQGNLCLNTPSSISGGPLVVKGTMKLDVNTNVGSVGSPINEAHIVGGCKYKNQPLHVLCGVVDKVFATRTDAVAPVLTPPVADFDGWYGNASPGPSVPCYGPLSSGPVPTLESTGDTLRNNSVPGVFDLTPSVSYDCWTAGGELKWDAPAKLLTIRGTIYIDGSAKVENGAVNEYNGQGSLYLSGTFYLHNSKLCGGLSADRSSCDFATWNPNTEMLVIVADGDGGQIPGGDSIQLKSAYLQGALYASKNIELDTTSNTEGPMIGGSVVIGQSVRTFSWPLITTVPSGLPGVPNVYAQPQPPGNYAG